MTDSRKLHIVSSKFAFATFFADLDYNTLSHFSHRSDFLNHHQIRTSQMIEYEQVRI